MGGALEQSGRGRCCGDQENRFFETGIDQCLLHVLGQVKVELIFGNAAGAECAGDLDGVADIDNDAERRPLTLGMRRLARIRSVFLAVC